MAKRMALVPESWLRQTMRPPEAPANHGPGTTVTLVEPPQHEKSDLAELAKLMPKSYRGRATTLLRSLDGKVKLNDQQHVLYPPNDQLGSHILDLVKYFVATWPTDRPIDAPKFAKLMTQAGVPAMAIAKKTQPQTKWQRLS